MKDIVIPAKKVKREVYILLGCFIFAFLLNIACIIIYKTRWIEIFTQIGYVIVIAVVLYLFVAFIRFLVYLIRKSLRKNSSSGV